jgi:hypothetical protein
MEEVQNEVIMSLEFLFIVLKNSIPTHHKKTLGLRYKHEPANAVYSENRAGHRCTLWAKF